MNQSFTTANEPSRQANIETRFLERNLVSVKWIVLAVLLGALFATLALLVAAQGGTYYETFTSTSHEDAAQTTAAWDTAAGQLRLHAPLPQSASVAGGLYAPLSWSPGVYVSDTGRVYLFGGTTIQEYDPATNSSVKLALALPHALRGAAAIHVESRRAIYLLGGSTQGHVLAFDWGQTPMTVTVLAHKLPVTLSFASAVYAPRQDKAYIFGGMASDGTVLNTIWEYDLTAGTVLTLPATLPVFISQAAAIYDPVTESAYLFGGQSYGYPLSRILKFTVADKTVTEAGSLPALCSGSSAVLVPEQRKAYLFGGLGRSLALSQTVEFDLSSTAVTALPAKLPFERYGSAAVYVPARATAYILGGHPDPYGYFLLSDVVAFDVNTRTATGIATGVDGRGGASAIYVPSTRKAYIFGGQSLADAASQSILVYDVQRVWVDTLSATLPVSRTDTAAIYNPATNQAYLFGGWQPGATPPYSADILRFDVATERVSSANATLPTGRAGMAAAYVPAKGKAYLFGGYDGSRCLDQILAYDPAQDRLMPLAATLPITVAYPAAAYDAATNKVYLFGGWNPALVSVPYLDQVVAFDVASETATLLSTKLPFWRGKATAIAIPGEGMAYVIGGVSLGGPRDDVLSFDAATGVVTRAQGIALSAPRSSAAAVYVPDQVTAYVFGGSGYALERPAYDIVKLQFAYPLSETAQSLMVNAAGEEIHQARLTAEQALRGGSVRYWLSNDGGRTWAETFSGARHTFAAAGSDLRWRAVLSGNGATTPIVDSLTIVYDGIVQYQVSLPVILKAYRR